MGEYMDFRDQDSQAANERLRRDPEVGKAPEILEDEHRPLEFHTSVLNFFEPKTPYRFLWSVEHFTKVARRAGYDGMQWVPVRSLAGVQLASGLVTQYGKDGIRSMEQSYRGEKTWAESWHHPNRSLAMLSHVVLPERTQSLDTLEQVQKRVGRSLPTVLHVPRPDVDEPSGTDRPFGEKLFQVTAATMHQWGAASVEDLAEKAADRDYTGFCVDLHHVREPHEAVTLYTSPDSLRALLPYTKMIQIPVGRFESPIDGVDINAEMQDLVHGTEETELLRMLRVIHDENWSGYVAFEAPAQSVRTMGDTWVGTHGRMVETAKRILVG